MGNLRCLTLLQPMALRRAHPRWMKRLLSPSPITQGKASIGVPSNSPSSGSSSSGRCISRPSH
ncbi:hypothetical protein Taro_035024, partial [Colocasia esculenta]|nr:hypothetical protein [Colocasia esculenta]